MANEAMLSASLAIPEENVDGTQAIRRAAAILRIIGQGGPDGVGLAAIMEALRLPRSTTHRILKCLSEEGLVKHEQDRRRYVVGRLTYELGLAVTSDTLEIARWHTAVQRVARRTGATSYLLGRSGIEAACLHKEEGNTVIRVIPVEVGQRRLLGVGAGSAALLAALDADTSERIIQSIAPALTNYPNLSPATIHKIVDEARMTGFAVSRSHVVKDVIGIGMAIPTADGTPHLALSIAALASQAEEGTIDEWKKIIRQEIESTLQG
jgi:DNA-binding IclR family transcriptional regulator